MEVEVVIPEVKGPADVAPAIERVRAAATDLYARGRYTEEAINKVARDLAEIDAAVKRAAELEVRVAKAEEMAKLAQESVREHDTEDRRGVEQLARLPIMRQWTDTDRKETGVDMPHAQYSLLAMSKAETVRMIGEGPGAAMLSRFRYLNDALYLTHAFMVQRAMIEGPEAVDRYLRVEGGVRSLKLWSPYERAMKAVRTIDTQGSGAASEWVPTMFSVQYFEDLTVPIGAADMFQWVDMPNNPYAWPIVTHGNTRSVKIIGEGTATNAGGYTNKDGALADLPSSANRLTLAVKKLGRFSAVSREINQDSIIALMPVIAGDITLEHGYARSILVINGQPISSGLGTFDTGRSLTAGSDPEDASASCIPASYGVRRSCHASGTPFDFAGALTAEGLAAMVGTAKMAGMVGFSQWLMGFAVEARLIVLKDSSNSNVYLTQEKAGAGAANATGQVTTLLGRPVVRDGMYPEDLNASGIYDGNTTTKTSLQLVRPDRFIGGRRQGMMLETSPHFLFDRDEIAIRSTERVCFAPKITPGTGINVKCGQAGVNIPSYN